MSGGGSAPSHTTSTQTSEPWSGAKPFLSNSGAVYDPKTGGYIAPEGSPNGVFQNAYNFYNQYGNLNGNQTGLVDRQSKDLTDLATYNPIIGLNNFNTGVGISNGRYDTNLSAVNPAQTYTAQNPGDLQAPQIDYTSLIQPAYTDPVNYIQPSYSELNTVNAAGINLNNLPQMNAANSDLQNARNAQGPVNPTSSLQQLLSGKVDNPYLAGMQQAATGTAMQQYNDAITHLNQQTMPNIAEDAFANGQYGSSREGIAQGLALQGMERNARDLGIASVNAGSNLYGNAYQNAQNMMNQTANNLNNQAGQNAQFNAGLQQSANQFNAGNALQGAQFNALLDQQANLANMAAANANQNFNSTMYQNAQQQNAANEIQNNQFNSSLYQQAATQNAANDLAVNQFNAGNAMDAAKTSFGANLQNNQFNAGNALQNSQFNANLGLSNNTQRLQQNQQNLNNALQGANLQNSAYQNYASNLDQLFNSKFKLSQLPQQQQQNVLDFLAGIIMPGAGAGGTTSMTQPVYTNTLGQVGGLLASGLGAYGALK